jgi:hypothetical protein
VDSMVIHAFVQQYNIYLQLAFLAILFVSMGLKIQKKFRLHGITMLSAVLLHLVSVVIVMIPSYANLLPLLSESALSALVIALLIHGVIGFVTATLAVWIVASWRLRQSLKYCMPKKKAMRLTLILWVITDILAFLLYVV